MLHLLIPSAPPFAPSFLCASLPHATSCSVLVVEALTKLYALFHARFCVLEMNEGVFLDPRCPFLLPDGRPLFPVTGCDMCDKVFDHRTPIDGQPRGFDCCCIPMAAPCTLHPPSSISAWATRYSVLLLCMILQTTSASKCRMSVPPYSRDKGEGLLLLIGVKPSFGLTHLQSGRGCRQRTS
jgi:hypothetical protein